jgi:polyisoprenoid-binding protein YceI
MASRRLSCRRAPLGACVGVVLATALSTSLDAQSGWTISSGSVTVVCPLTVGGSFEAKTTSLSGRLAADTSRQGALSGQLEVDLATLDSGIGLRNTHMRDNYLEVGKGEGYSRAVLKDIVLGADPATVTGAATFTATLLVHGVERPVKGNVRVARAGSDVRVDATFPVLLPDHGISKPRYLGVGVRDEVQVKVKFQASAGEGSTRSSR